MPLHSTIKRFRQLTALSILSIAAASPVSAHLYLKYEGEDIFRDNSGGTGVKCSDEREVAKLSWEAGSTETLQWRYAPHGEGNLTFHLQKTAESEFEQFSEEVFWTQKTHTFTVPNVECDACVIKATYQPFEDTRSYNSCVDIKITAANAVASVPKAVQDVFDANCTFCHSGKRSPDLSDATTSYSSLVGKRPEAEGCSESTQLVSETALEDSLLHQTINGTQKCAKAMPIGGELSQQDLQTLGDWMASLVPDDEAPEAVISFESMTYSVDENKGSVDIEVVTSGSDHEAFSVEYVTKNGSAKDNLDYVAQSSTLDFGAGENKKVITISISDDEIHEEDEKFSVILKSVQGPAKLENDANSLTAKVTIIDNDMVDDGSDDNGSDDSNDDGSDDNGSDDSNDDGSDDNVSDDSNDDGSDDNGSDDSNDDGSDDSGSDDANNDDSNDSGNDSDNNQQDNAADDSESSTDKEEEKLAAGSFNFWLMLLSVFLIRFRITSFK